MVVKTSVYLEAEDKRRLSALARATGTSEAELLRRGVRLVLGERLRPHVGIAASSDGRSARDADRLLEDTDFGAR